MFTASRRARSFWDLTSAENQAAARASLIEVIEANTDSLVNLFYDIFLADEEASQFLSHTVVQSRLSASLRNWLRELMTADPHTDLTTFDQRQTKIGEVHARLKIPVHLVLAGGSVLKTELAYRILDKKLESSATAHCIMMADEMIDYSMRLMSAAYFNDTKRRVRNDEAFRLFSLGQDINLERETQRAALMEWCQSVLFGLFGQRGVAAAGELSGSAFGLWVRHRGTMLFHGSPILPTIEQLMLSIDTIALPKVDAMDPNSVADLQRRVDEIKYLLNDLFQTASNVENGRDPLTRTLNRRFLPTVLGREISLATQDRTALSVLMVDVDYFKQINDRYSHASGDIVLSQTAETLLNAVRASDFVFRYGGEEFLVVLVETNREEAQIVAERIRAEIAAQTIHLPEHGQVSISVSIGLAVHEGHPDYEFLISAADKALYEAKNSGRNRVIAASAQPA